MDETHPKTHAEDGTALDAPVGTSTTATAKTKQPKKRFIGRKTANAQDRGDGAATSTSTSVEKCKAIADVAFMRIILDLLAHSSSSSTTTASPDSQSNTA